MLLKHTRGWIANRDLQEITGAIRKTVARDLDDLVSKGILVHHGSGGGVHYVLVRKRDMNGTNKTNGNRSTRSKMWH